MARRTLHLLRFPLLLAAVLYGPAPGRASEAPEVRANAAPAAPSRETATAPHLGLLLPTGSQSFARAAESVRRLYALGVDACRLANDLRSGKREIERDGVTGRLTLGPDSRFRRALLVMLIDGGRLTILGESRR